MKDKTDRNEGMYGMKFEVSFERFIESDLDHINEAYTEVRDRLREVIQKEFPEHTIYFHGSYRKLYQSADETATFSPLKRVLR